MDWHTARASRSHKFKKAFRLVCGPELRTRQTAELFGSEMQIISALRDYDFGRWQGLRIKDLQMSEPAALHSWLENPHLSPHGGESRVQLCNRVAEWLATLESTPGHIVAVTHPDVIRAALTHVLKGAAFNDIDVEPLSAIELRFNGRWRWRLRLSGADDEEKG